MTIGLVALREQYEQLKPKIDAAIASVIQRSAFIAGSDVGDFERWFRDFCGVRHALGVSSGTTALELVLRALKVGAMNRAPVADAMLCAMRKPSS